jgi:hypothetical protein
MDADLRLFRQPNLTLSPPAVKRSRCKLLIPYGCRVALAVLLPHKEILTMKRFLLLAALLVAPLAAQPNVYNASGYGLFGITFPPYSPAASMLSVGGGGEAFVWKGLAVGADLSYFFPREYYSDGYGMLGVGPAWHFVNRRKPGHIDPFINGGYALAFRYGVANFYYLGGGANFWFNNHIGTRIEFRNYAQSDRRWNSELRFAVTFR